MKSQENQNSQFNIIHLSDLHMGMTGQRWMWPTFKKNFFIDLKNLYNKTGAWDLVIFSGDLTQKSSPEEYAALTVALKELWEIFSSLGCTPKLFVVPGNHDLKRPSTIDACALALGSWWQNPTIHQDFWENSKSQYRKTVSLAFTEYLAWTASLEETPIPILTDQLGLLPGDVSARLEKGDISLGLVGLNSAWLQLNGKNSLGHLNVHARQLQSVTNGDPDAWSSKNTFNLLVTHHPTNWLHANAMAHWNSEIDVNMRFNAHLFGHMHDSVTRQTSINGGYKKIAIQSPSIFGLEMVSEDLLRNHGYTSLRLTKNADGCSLKIWPRFAFPLKDGARRIIADPNWELIDECCELDLSDRSSSRPATTSHTPTSEDEKNQEISFFNNEGASRILSNLRKSNYYTRASASVRKEEQQFFAEVLNSKRYGWLVDTWGTGGDEFINVISNTVIGSEAEIYYLPVGAFEGQESFLSSIQPRFGRSLEDLCRVLDQRPCMLILDDLNIEGINRHHLEQELLFIVQTLVEFSEHLHIIIRTRSRPSDQVTFSELLPLDEVDVAAYVSSHEKTANLSQETIAHIFRHSGGLPTRIDGILKAIEIVGTQALFDLDVDIAGKSAAQSNDIPRALIDTIQELNTSDEDHSRRAASLLKVLSLFPQGETLARVRRFFGAKELRLSHAMLLINLGLIDSNPINSMHDFSLPQEQGNALTVRRPVREYLVQALSATELKQLNSKALVLYFGENWSSKGIRSSSDLKFSSPRRSALEIENAGTLILREARAATEGTNRSRVNSALSLSVAFVRLLEVGDHFRGMVHFLDGAVKIFQDYAAGQKLEKEAEPSLDLSELLCTQAISLRMIGQKEKAHTIALSIDLNGKSNAFKERTLQAIALCKQSLKAPVEEIIAAAEACRKINPRGRISLSARYIIASNEDTPEKKNKLNNLYDEARKKGIETVANNIALDLAVTSPSSEQKMKYYKSVMLNGQDKDHYNFVRALLLASRLSLDETGTIPTHQFDDCARAYSYLYNQRIDGLLGSCHGILWDIFKKRGDIKNLLVLYRHSSLVWRLRQKSEIEHKYQIDLAKILGDRLSGSILAADRELRYYISRSASSSGKLLNSPK